jgi:UDP-3-O-[3-hydroxymyristoyl] glucosamine N-acyltransferase
MEHPGFFERAAPLRLEALAQMVGAQVGAGADAGALIEDVRGLADAGAGHVTFLDNRRYLAQLATTRATACLIAPAFTARVPQGVAALVTALPYRAFAMALQHFYPDAMLPKAAMTQLGDDPPIHPTARLEEGVLVEPGAIVGREAQIGRGTTVAAGALIGYRVTIGRGGYRARSPPHRFRVEFVGIRPRSERRARERPDHVPRHGRGGPLSCEAGRGARGQR